MQGQIEMRARPLPWRDLIILPLIFVATMLLLSVPTELAARALWPDVPVDDCVAPTATGMAHAKPHCISRTKAAEGPWAVNQYNECGYRSSDPCGPRPAGTPRIAMVGTSTAAGWVTPYEDTTAGRVARALTRRCGRVVQVENLGAPGINGTWLAASAEEAISLTPDVLVIMISPIDLNEGDSAAPQVVPAPRPAGLLPRLRQFVGDLRLLYVASFFILRNDDTYLPMFLGFSANADFMRAPLSAAWQRKLRSLDIVLSQIANVAKAHDIPAVLLFVPQRAEAILASSPHPDERFDPELLPNAIHAAARSHGMMFVDVTKDIPRNVQSESLFYAINGHPNAGGHAVIAESLINHLMTHDIRPFGALCGHA